MGEEVICGESHTPHILLPTVDGGKEGNKRKSSFRFRLDLSCHTTEYLRLRGNQPELNNLQRYPKFLMGD
jgi:hypothetical protein